MHGLPNRSYYLLGLCKPFGICFEKLSAQGAADASLPTTGGCSSPRLAQPSRGVKATPGRNPDHPLARVRGRAAWSVPL